MAEWKRLTDLRESRNLSKKELAGILHVSREAVQSWESGVRTPPLPMIIELAEFFGVSVDYLIGRTKEGEFSLSKDELKKLEEVAKILTKIISQQKP